MCVWGKQFLISGRKRAGVSATINSKPEVCRFFFFAHYYFLHFFFHDTFFVCVCGKHVCYVWISSSANLSVNIQRGSHICVYSVVRCFFSSSSLLYVCSLLSISSSFSISSSVYHKNSIYFSEATEKNWLLLCKSKNCVANFLNVLEKCLKSKIKRKRKRKKENSQCCRYAWLCRFFCYCLNPQKEIY